MIRRKSDQAQIKTLCAYGEQLKHELNNQQVHEARHGTDVQYSPCWCCCSGCTDLTWYYVPRKGRWWQPSASGGLQLMRETSVGSPGLPVIKPCS